MELFQDTSVISYKGNCLNLHIFMFNTAVVELHKKNDP